MRGYFDIYRSTSACVHFVEAHEINSEDMSSLKTQLEEAGISYFYIDAEELVNTPLNTCNAVALAIKAEHAPHGEAGAWFKLLDDMITLSTELSGMVIVIDNADQLMAVDRTQVFDLMESFLIQFHHWFKKEKPCHICFQMSPSPLVRTTFAKT